MRTILLAAMVLATGTVAATAQSVVIGDEDEVVIRRIIREPAPRVVLKERVEVGAVLPGTVDLESFPDDVEGRTVIREYRYVRDSADRVVVVEPGTRRVVRVIDR